MSGQPVIYEINTWVWLHDLSEHEGRTVSLADVPGRVWDELGALGIDTVWFMGVWTRSKASRRIALAHPDLQAEFDRALPHRTPADVIGSAYAIQRYEVDPHLGGNPGLATAREALRQRGVGILLDYVPNHVAIDHPWVANTPECLVTFDASEGQSPRGTFQCGETIIAHGRDPYFPPWTDTAQLNAYSPALREHTIGLLSHLATQCDGVRCDMAMLMLSDVFSWTWAGAAGPAPKTEFWSDVIGAIKELNPDFLFLAESYWDMEHRLLELGFDWAYDKTFYDRLLHHDPSGIQAHVEGTSCTRTRLVKFTENHDEPRGASAFGKAFQAANVAAALMPGVWLIHEGQRGGRKVRCPVQLGRRVAEKPARDLLSFHTRLLKIRHDPAFRLGRYRALHCHGWPDNSSNENLLAWVRETDHQRFVVVVNLSRFASQARIPLPYPEVEATDWLLVDDLHGETYERCGKELRAPGLFVDLAPWGSHVFRLRAKD